MEFTRLECRDILANINKTNVDPDVLAKLMQGAEMRGKFATVEPVSESTAAAIIPTGGPAGGAFSYLHEAAFVKATMDDYDPPPYTPVTYTDAELAKLNEWNKSIDPNAKEITQADVAETNRIKREAQLRDWITRRDYRAIVGENKDPRVAHFDAPDRPPGFDPNLEHVPVGQKNRAGDVCVEVDRNGNSTFRCASGHGYQQSRSLRSCPTCFLTGGSVGTETVQEDRGAIPGYESF